MLLITEDNFDGINAGHIIEEGTSKKNYYVRGIFLQSEEKNRNGRIYPSHLLEREVNRFTTEYINNKRSLGELNHPQEPSINPERACQLIESLVKEGDNWIGKAKILSTPLGNLVKGLIDDGVQLGESSRGLGTLTECGKRNAKIVNEDFYMSTIDIVSDPSAHKAWVNGIYEGREFYMGDDEQFIDKVKKQIDNESSKVNFSMVDEQVTIIAFEKFMNRLNG